MTAAEVVRRDGPAAIRIDHDQQSITKLLLDRPHKRNALGVEEWAALEAALVEAVSDPSRVVMVGSAVPGVFSAGFDMEQTTEIGADSRLDRGLAAAERCYARLSSCDKVTVSFADGKVVGGGLDLYGSCDVRLGTPRTTFRMPVARLGAMLPLAALRRMLGMLGATATREIVLVGRELDAEDALRLGLLTRIVANEAEAREYLHAAAGSAPLSTMANKRAIELMLRCQHQPEIPANDLAELTALRAVVFGSRDRAEGLAAFYEKREPLFHGR